MPNLVFNVVFWVSRQMALEGLGAFLIKAGTSALLSLGAAKLFAPKIPDGARMSGLSVTKRSALEYRKIVYGQAMVSGPIVYSNLSGASGKYLWNVIALADGESEDLVSVWFDDNPIIKSAISWTAGTGGADGTGTGDVSTGRYVGENSTAGASIFYYLGEDAQPVCGALNTAFSDIGTNHRLRGVTYLVTRFLYDVDTESVWKGGPPSNIKALIKGRKIYDPRLDGTQIIDQTTSPVTYGTGSHRTTDSTTWAWSDNPALCVADYLMNVMGVSSAYIDWPSIADGADDCDVSVSIIPASPITLENRFTCNGSLSLGSTHKDNLDILLSSCDGKLSYTSGVWKFRASVWEASSVSLDENDLAGDIVIRGSSPKSDRFNTVRGYFIDPDRKYEASEFPHVTDATYLTRDNGKVISADLQLPMTNSKSMCQRIATRRLRQSDNQIICEAKLNARGAKVAIGDVVTLDIDELGWTSGGNLIIQSEDSTQWPATRATAAVDGYWQVLSEDGTAASSHYFAPWFGTQPSPMDHVFPADDTDYILSFEAKAINRTWVNAFMINQAGSVPFHGWYDLENGTAQSLAGVDTVVGIENMGGGVFKCWMRVNSGATGTVETLQLYIAEAYNDLGFDGLSQESIKIRKLQLHEGTEPGLYQPTTTAPVTTAAKTFRCIEWSRNPEGTFDVTLQEDSAASYSDPAVVDYSDTNTGGTTIPSDSVPAPSNLAATAVPLGVSLTWTNPPDATYDAIYIYEETSATWGSPEPTLIGSVGSGTNSVVIPHDSGTYYYWIRAVSLPNLVSSRNPDSDTSTVTATPLPPADSIGDVSDFSVDAADSAAQWGGFRIDSDGDIYLRQGGSGSTYSSIQTWQGSGSAADYEVKVVKQNSGDDDPNSVNSGLNSWLSCGTDRTYEWSALSAPLDKAADPIVVSWRRTSDNIVLATINVDVLVLYI